MIEYLFNRSEVAQYLGVSRMTLSRWEKHVPLVKGTLRANAFHLDGSDVDAWYRKLKEKYHPRQPYLGRRQARA